MAKHKIFAVPGTWEAVAFARQTGGAVPRDAQFGMLLGVTRDLEPPIFDVEYIAYPGSFGPIAGGGQDPLAAWSFPSYEKSRDESVVTLIDKIREHSGSFGLVGYSQGGAVVSIVGRELLSGSLQSRKGDCKWVHTFASPHRGPGRTFHLGNQLGGQGISGDNITHTGEIDWFDYCLPGDIYGDADRNGTYLTLGYDQVTPLQLTDPFAFAAKIAENLLPGGSLAHAAQQLGENPIVALQKAFKTGVDLSNFLRDFPHDKYGVWDIKPGWTAIRHSNNHLHFWGPRR